MRAYAIAALVGLLAAQAHAQLLSTNFQVRVWGAALRLGGCPHADADMLLLMIRSHPSPFRTTEACGQVVQLPCVSSVGLG
jgi:hypothetical protein